QPGLEGTPTLKPVEVRQRLDEPVLNGIKGIRLAAQKAVGHAVRRRTVAAKKLVECIPISRAMTRQQLLVAKFRRGGYGEERHDAARSPTGNRRPGGGLYSELL